MLKCSGPRPVTGAKAAIRAYPMGNCCKGEWVIGPSPAFHPPSSKHFIFIRHRMVVCKDPPPFLCFFALTIRAHV